MRSGRKRSASAVRYILSSSSRPVLKELARENTLCAFDFDGTLAPIVDQPEKANLRDETRRALARLSTLYPCIVVSGRAGDDVRDRLQGLQLARVIGNHGAEGAAFDGGETSAFPEWKAELRKLISVLPGVQLEDKGLSLAIHYRQSTDKSTARRRILAAASELRDSHVFGGKQVVNVVHAGAPNKGDALADERERLACDHVIFVGDDDNDEAAFALRGKVVSVRVGLKKTSHARYYVRRQAEVDELIRCLVYLREQQIA